MAERKSFSLIGSQVCFYKVESWVGGFYGTYNDDSDMIGGTPYTRFTPSAADESLHNAEVGILGRSKTVLTRQAWMIREQLSQAGCVKDKPEKAKDPQSP